MCVSACVCVCVCVWMSATFFPPTLGLRSHPPRSLLLHISHFLGLFSVLQFFCLYPFGLIAAANLEVWPPNVHEECRLHPLNFVLFILSYQKRNVEVLFFLIRGGEMLFTDQNQLKWERKIFFLMEENNNNNKNRSHKFSKIIQIWLQLTVFTLTSQSGQFCDVPAEPSSLFLSVTTSLRVTPLPACTVRTGCELVARTRTATNRFVPVEPLLVCRSQIRLCA